MTIFVSGHPGAAEWARRRGIAALHVRHLDLADIRPDMNVMGTLPPHLIIEVCALGARFYHLAMDLKTADRHRDIPADEMEALNARLIRIEVRQIKDDNDPMKEFLHAD